MEISTSHIYAMSLVENNCEDLYFIGCGCDGICYRLPNNDIIKMLTDELANFDRNIEEEGFWDEQISLYCSYKTGNHLCPEIKNLGTFFNMPTIIREDLKDIPLNKTEKNKIKEFITSLKNLYFSIEKEDFYDKIYTKELTNDIVFPQGLPSIFNEKFAYEFMMLQYDLENDFNILVQDLHGENFGIDKYGNLKIRDMSRFVIMNLDLLSLKFEEKLEYSFLNNNLKI